MTADLRPWSLRRRLTTRVLGLVIGGWLATIAVSALVLDHEMNEMFDEELSALVETTVLFLDTTGRAGGGADIPRMLGVAAGDGERVLRILAPGVAADTPIDAPKDASPWPALSRDGFHDVPGWRVLRRSAEGVVIEAAHATTWRREEMLEAASAFLVLVLPLAALLLWGVRRTVTRATAPVARLAGAVSGRGPDDLSPVDAGDLPRELRPLALSFNQYLARIEALRQAERDFIANAAHELRTPLAGIRNRLALSADPDAIAAIALLDGLTRRVDRLLQLSRLEAGLGFGRGPCDLLRVLRLVCDDLRPMARHPIRLDDSDLETLLVAADPDALAILLRNLIENALVHGTGTVQLRLTPDAKLIAENPALAPVLPEARFVPGMGSPGLGLGLSIVDTLARAMGVRLALQVGADHVRVALHFARAGVSR